MAKLPEVAGIDPTANQWAAKLSAVAVLAETVVDEGQTGQADGNAVLIDGEVSIQELAGLAAFVQSDDGADVPEIQ